jgi:hypothetical protein
LNTTLDDDHPGRFVSLVSDPAWPSDGVLGIITTPITASVNGEPTRAGDITSAQ